MKKIFLFLLLMSTQFLDAQEIDDIRKLDTVYVFFKADKNQTKYFENECYTCRGYYFLEGFFLPVCKGVGRGPLSMGCCRCTERPCAAAQNGLLLTSLPICLLQGFEWGARTRVSAALSECRPF